MKRPSLVVVVFLLSITLIALGIYVSTAQAGPAEQSNIPRGAALYDRWYAVLKKNPPAGNMPLWATQTTNTRSGEDTWRCVSCHGWDYQGKDGANRAGSNYTGFPGVYKAGQTLKTEEIIAILKGGKNPQHNFSAYIDDASLKDLADFIKTALVDDTQYIDPVSLAVKGGDLAKGKQAYEKVCASCHGADGKTIKMRFEGRDATLGTLANLDPWRFLHKTRFGNPGSPMAVGFEQGWTAQDGRDVLLYARSLPSGLDPVVPPPSMEGRDQGGNQPGGPLQGIFGGILTAIGAMATSLGFALLILALLVGIIFLVVWLIRGRSR